MTVTMTEKWSTVSGRLGVLWHNSPLHTLGLPLLITHHVFYSVFLTISLISLRKITQKLGVTCNCFQIWPNTLSPLLIVMRPWVVTSTMTQCLRNRTSKTNLPEM